MEQAPKPIRRVRFGEFEVDFLDRCLYRQGLKIKINERPLQVLSVLVARRGEMVRREEFQQAIWPSDANVNFDPNLNTALTTLRHALGDSSRNPVFIKTVPRRGYRFIAPVIPIDDDCASIHSAPEDIGSHFRRFSCTRSGTHIGKTFYSNSVSTKLDALAFTAGQIVSVRSGPKDKIEARSFGERPEVPVSREKRNAYVNTALSDQRIAETRFAALCQHLRSQPSRPLPVAG